MSAERVSQYIRILWDIYAARLEILSAHTNTDGQQLPFHGRTHAGNSRLWMSASGGLGFHVWLRGTLNIVTCPAHCTLPSTQGQNNFETATGKTAHGVAHCKAAHLVNLKNYTHFASTGTCHGCVDFQMREHTKCVVLQQFHSAPLHSLRVHAQSARCKKRCSSPAYIIYFAVVTKETIKSPNLQKCISLQKSCQASLPALC